MSDETDLRRAERAREVLAEPLIIEAFQTLEKLYLDNWRTTRPEDSASRETQYHKLRALDAVRGELQSMIATGRIVESRQVKTPSLRALANQSRA